MKIGAVILFLSLSLTKLSGQSILHGRITDQSGTGLAGVSIFIPELERKTITDESGRFRFEHLEKGIIRLQCSMVGFRTIVQKVDLGHLPDELNLQLEQTSISIEEVVVTSNQTELARNIPYPITSVSAEEIQHSPQPTLMEKMAQQPGVDLISAGSGISKPVIRGLSFNRIVTYSMGTRIENQQWDDDHDAGISEAGIEKAEIVYGPSALIYGADALGGAMIFIDEKPAPAGKQGGSVHLGYYSNTLGINSAASFKKTDSSGYFYMIHFNDHSHTDYIQGKSGENGSTPYATNSKFDNLSGKATMGLSKNWGVSKLTYSYLRSLAGIIADESEDSLAAAEGNPYEYRSRSMKAPSQRVDIHVISSENTLLSGNSKWNINTAYQVNNRKEFEEVPPGEAPYTAMGLLLHTFTYDVKRTSNEENKLSFTTGTQGMIQSNTNFGNNIAVPDADVNDFAGYGMARYNREHWNFSGGLRFDVRSIRIKETAGVHEGEATLDSTEEAALIASGITGPVSSFTKQYFPFSFSLGTAYHPQQNIAYKLNVATGFSAPNYSELSTFGKHEGTNRFEIGNPDLRAEQNLETDLSITWDMKDLSLVASGYYNFIKDYIYLSPTNNYIADLQIIEYAQQDAVIQGGSMTVNIHPAAVKWIEWNSTFSLISGKLTGRGNLPYIPANKLSNELEFEAGHIGKILHPYFSILVHHYFAQDHPALYEEPSSGYQLVDLSTGGDFNIGKQNLHASVFCTNLFDLAYYNHLSIVKDIGVYERGRNIGLRLQYSFGN